MMELSCKPSSCPSGRQCAGLHSPSAIRRQCLRSPATRASCSSAAQDPTELQACNRRAAVSYAGPAEAEGYQTSSTGLKFIDTKIGTGKEATKGTQIRCHYTGRLSSNGQVFDSSYERRRPLTFTIGVRQVIQGWDLGIVGTDDIPAMKEGGKRKLIIPPELGYGSRGAGGKIPPNAVLEFDVEYLGKK